MRSALDPRAGVMGLSQLLVDGIYAPERVQQLIDNSMASAGS
ncbi:hypothetical protein [Streptomyces sp. NPDC101776]